MNRCFKTLPKGAFPMDELAILEYLEDWHGDIDAVCTVLCEDARDAIGYGEIWGFFDEDNPGTETAAVVGGHDFLVCDGRWIVDLWVKHVAGLSDRCVFDLMDPDDQSTIYGLYGNRTKWTRVPH
jgi:hypothetical protein